MDLVALDTLPGFRRRFRVTPSAGCVTTEVEDDYHRMEVTLRHDGRVATSVEGRLIRAPWTTCPGATAQVRDTFTGVALAEFPARGGKPANCTHLYDLALLGAAHAFEASAFVYEMLIGDPVDGERRAEIRRDGVTVFGWTEKAFRIVAPEALAGNSLQQLKPWVDALAPHEQEAVRLLRWANMIANGRQIPLERQSDASRMPSTCYTFQPERKTIAVRVGVIRDFRPGSQQPLEEAAA